MPKKREQSKMQSHQIILNVFSTAGSYCTLEIMYFLLSLLLAGYFKTFFCQLQTPLFASCFFFFFTTYKSYCSLVISKDFIVSITDTSFCICNGQYKNMIKKKNIQQVGLAPGFQQSADHKTGPPHNTCVETATTVTYIQG